MNTSSLLKRIFAREDELLAGCGLPQELALALGALDGPGLLALLPLTDRLRRRFCGSAIALCAIANAKSGRCPEDCAFCAQSSAHATGVKVFPLLEVEELLARVRAVRAWGVENFSVVTSGTAVTSSRERNTIAAMLTGISRLGIGPCASLGFLDAEAAALYRKAGLKHYHHNLETARSYFPTICSTHTYDMAVATIETAKTAGFYLCSGGILGLGESWAQRVELAFELRRLEVDSIPLNFLVPVPGTRLEHAPGLAPFAALQAVILFRLVNPTRAIRICGGRQRAFGDFQGLLFAAGASGLMVGNYLTTKGRQWDDDARLLEAWRAFAPAAADPSAAPGAGPESGND